MTSPQAGDYAVIRTNDPFGFLIRLVTHGTVNHAVLCIGNGKTVEMNPSGAAYGTVEEYKDEQWFRPAGQYPVATRDVVTDAKYLVDYHVGYGFLDIAAQFVYRVLHIRPVVLLRWIQKSNRMVCSQSVDWCYSHAGIHLFDDGRPAGLVSPQDLLVLGQEKGWAI